MNAAPHTPVMLDEVLAALAPRDNGIYVDATFGRGGYSRGLLGAAKTQVYGIDRDPEAIAAGKTMSQEFASRLKLLQGPFGAMDVLLAGEHVSGVDGIALDLGVSSPQLDDASRGFSFRADGPLDMRMSKSGPTAADAVRELSERDLADIIHRYGEERHARRVAKYIVAARAEGPITRTAQLAEIVRRAVPRSADGVDPATRTFQALRIYVNDELDELARGLAAAETLLKPQGRLAVVSFHSLEDRTVKEFFRRRSAGGASASRHLPVANDRSFKASLRVLTRKPQIPSAEEMSRNPRARSAKLRVAERTDAPVLRENAA
jgi:16S rRNA (cytosine1402-N4)-methyltransferase